MQLATWGTYRFKADAQKCADEIMEICDELELRHSRFLTKQEIAILNFTSALHGTIPKLPRNGEYRKPDRL